MVKNVPIRQMARELFFKDRMKKIYPISVFWIYFLHSKTALQMMSPKQSTKNNIFDREMTERQTYVHCQKRKFQLTILQQTCQL